MVWVLQVFALVSPERFMVLDGEPLNRREIEELRRRMFQPSPLPAFPQVDRIDDKQYMGPAFLVLKARVDVSRHIAACPSDVCLLGSDAQVDLSPAPYGRARSGSFGSSSTGSLTQGQRSRTLSDSGPRPFMALQPQHVDQHRPDMEEEQARLQEDAVSSSHTRRAP